MLLNCLLSINVCTNSSVLLPVLARKALVGAAVNVEILENK